MAIRVCICPGCNFKINPADRRPEGLLAGSGQVLQPAIQPYHLSGSPEDGKDDGIAEKCALGAAGIATRELFGWAFGRSDRHLIGRCRTVGDSQGYRRLHPVRGFIQLTGEVNGRPGPQRFPEFGFIDARQLQR